MTRMLEVSIWLFVALAGAFLLLWFQPWDSDTTVVGDGKAAGGGVAVKFDAALAEKGKQVAGSNGCGACHSADGSKSVGPGWKGTWGQQVELTSGGPVKLDEKFVETAIYDPPAEVRKGFSPSMSSYEGKLGAADVKAIAEYMKSLAK